jgi:hypothetical protein
MAFVVLSPINLNDEVVFHAHKIHDVRANRFLALEFQAQKAMSTQVVPETVLSSGLVASQLLGELQALSAFAH